MGVLFLEVSTHHNQQSKVESNHHEPEEYYQVGVGMVARYIAPESACQELLVLPWDKKLSEMNQQHGYHLPVSRSQQENGRHISSRKYVHLHCYSPN